MDETAPSQNVEPLVVFPLDVRYPFAHLSRLFAVQPQRARLELRGEQLIAIFGPWRVATSISNIDTIRVTGPYAPLKVIGPPRLSFSDGGITFATNADAGICIRFREAVPGLLPIPLTRHESLTITVADPEQVKSVLERAVRITAEAPDGSAATVRLEQNEQDVIHAMTSADLRERARILGIENANSLSHSELVDAMESGVDASSDHDV